MREIIISKQEEGQRLDRYLGKYLPQASSGFLHKMLRKKNIKLNQARAAGDERLKNGDRIQIYFSEETLQTFQGTQNKSTGEIRKKASSEKKYPDRRKRAGLNDQEKRLRRQVKLLYQNEHILVFHKPAGMLTQKADIQDDSLNDYLLDYWRETIMSEKELPVSFRPSVANRLDRNTSGIVLCGITVKGLQTLTGLLKARTMEKYYLCIVKGKVTENRKICGYLKKDEKHNRVELYEKQIPGSVPIETWYDVADSGEDASLLKVRLITGKSHQIRAHLSSVGHPILGDGKYGDPVMNHLLYKAGIRYHMLHSSELIIPDTIPDIPVELSGLRIQDPPPEEFMKLMEMYNLQMGE